MCRSFPSCLLICAICLGFITDSAAEAQGLRPRSRTGRAKKLPATQLEIHLLTDQTGADRTAQQWSEYFEKMDVAVRIRRGNTRDEPGVTEKNIGDSIRTVMVIAEMDRRGQLNLPDRSFKLSDTAKLTEWLNELRTYGAQGSPDGQPAWGLTKEQMDRVLNTLKRPLAVDPQGKDLLAAMVLFAPNREQGDLPFHVTPEAKQIMALPRGEELFPQSLAGMSRGSALAIVLKYYGLCFAPQRTPDGGLELAIRDVADTKQPWRIGWPWPTDVPRTKLAPNLFKFVTVDLDDQPLPDVLDAAAAAIEIPIVVDFAGLDEWQIDYEKQRITYPRKKTTWGLAINHIAFQARLRRELYVDEGGKPFIWITPIQFKRKPTSVEAE